MGRPSKSASAELVRAQQTEDLLKLVVTGESIAGAAEKLGISADTAGRLYRNALRKVYEDNATLREEVLGKELKTLDLLQRALWPSAQRGHVRSIEVMLGVMDRRAKYLGLDAAVKIQLEAARVDEALAKVASIIDSEAAIAPAPLLRILPGAQ